MKLLLSTLLSQATGFLCGALLGGKVAGIMWFIPDPVIIPIVYSLGAGSVSAFLGLSPWWVLFNISLPWVIMFSLSFGFPSWVVGVFAFFLVLLFAPTLFTSVPYYPTSRPMYVEVEKLIRREYARRFIDLGCGFGGLLFQMAKRFPEVSFEGIEISLLGWFWCKIRSILHRNVSIKLGSLWNLNLSGYDIVYAFLAPQPMERLWGKVQREMDKGSLFVSNTFETPEEPDEIVEVDDERKTKLLIFRL